MSLVNQQIRRLAERVAASHGLDVVDLESQGGGGKHRTLRVFLERNAEGRAVMEQRLAALRAGNGTQGMRPELWQGARQGGQEEEAHELEQGEEGSNSPDGFPYEDDKLDEPEEPDSDDLDEPGEDEGDEPGHEASAGSAEAGAIVLDLVDAGEVAGLSPDEDELAYLREVPPGVPVAQLSGITHGDCERFSRDFGTALDIEDLIPGAEYLLEASSPGLDRKLSTAEEFRRFAGCLCKVQTFTAVAGNRHWQGRLEAMDGEGQDGEGRDGEVLRLTPLAPKGAKKKRKNGEAEASPSVEIALSNVEKAQLVPEF